MHDDLKIRGSEIAHARRPRHWRRMTWAATFLILTGCSYVHTMPIPDEAGASSASSGKTPHDSFHSRGGQEIRGYTTRDSVHHAFHGFARVHGDTIQFGDFPENGWGEQSAPKIVNELPRDQVLSVDKTATNVPVTVALLVVLGAVVAVLIIGSALANQPDIPPF
jgi:hypothetical protein